MDILGYEIDIYLVIVALAGIVVLSIMLLIGNSMKGKKPSSKKGKGERKQRDKRGESLELSPAKNEGKPQQPEKLLPASAGKPPEELRKPSVTNRPVAPNEIQSLLIKNTTDAEKSAPAGTDTENKVTADTEAAKSAPAGADAEKSTPPVTRLWGTETAQGAKEETEEEKQEKEEDTGGGLMDVFGDEDVEDTGLSELAALLADIDVDTLKKLSSEVSQVLAKKKAGSQRRC